VFNHHSSPKYAALLRNDTSQKPESTDYFTVDFH